MLKPHYLRSLLKWSWKHWGYLLIDHLQQECQMPLSQIHSFCSFLQKLPEKIGSCLETLEIFRWPSRSRAGSSPLRGLDPRRHRIRKAGEAKNGGREDQARRIGERSTEEYQSIDPAAKSKLRSSPIHPKKRRNNKFQEIISLKTENSIKSTSLIQETQTRNISPTLNIIIKVSLDPNVKSKRNPGE